MKILSDQNNDAGNNKLTKPKNLLRNFVNLRAKYDGFNRLRFIYPRIVPKLVEEKDFILPCSCKQLAHRC